MRFDQSIETLRESLRDFSDDWDDRPLGILRREHVLSVLRRWRAGELSDREVEDWANLVEMRDDLDHDPDDKAVATAVFILANPVLEGRLSEEGPKLLNSLSTPAP
jgi:hypothetical protein